MVLVEEDGGGYSILDAETGVASQGETRPEALRMLAEALELHADAGSEMTPEEVYEELGVDPEEVDESANPPWE